MKNVKIIKENTLKINKMFLLGNFYKNDSLCSSQVAFWECIYRKQGS